MQTLVVNELSVHPLSRLVRAGGAGELESPCRPTVFEINWHQQGISNSKTFGDGLIAWRSFRMLYKAIRSLGLPAESSMSRWHQQISRHVYCYWKSLCIYFLRSDRLTSDEGKSQDSKGTRVRQRSLDCHVDFGRSNGLGTRTVDSTAHQIQTFKTQSTPSLSSSGLAGRISGVSPAKVPCPVEGSCSKDSKTVATRGPYHT